MRLFYTACLAFLLLLPAQLFAANDPSPVGARTIALGFAYTGVRGDFWSLFHNPAGIAGIESRTAGIYATRRFGLKELTYGSFGIASPLAEGKHFVGLDVSSFGFELYRENRVGLTYATTVIEKVSLGAKLNYAILSIPNYGSTGSFMLDVGINVELNEQLALGFSANNVNRAKLKTNLGEEAQPTVITAGVAYHPIEKVLVVMDIQKDEGHPASLRAGVEYKLTEALVARLGTSTEPLSWSGGFGVKVSDFKLDFAFGYHERLGFSPHLSLAFDF